MNQHEGNITMPSSAKGTLRGILTFPAAYILTDIGFRLARLNPDHFGLKLALVKYALWLVLLAPFYWVFGRLGQRLDNR
jgi:hypothetical protein